MQAIHFKKLASVKPEIPTNWIIFNALTPIWGHKTWRGDFIHGSFYAAINPNENQAEYMINENISFGAWVIEYITMKDIDEWIINHAAEIGIDPSEFDLEDKIDSYFCNIGKEIKEIA